MDDWRQLRFTWLRGVLASAELSPRAKNLGAAFVTIWADKRTGECNPSHRTIAGAIGGCSPKTVERAVNELFNADWLSVRPGQGRGNYTFYALRLPPGKGVKSDDSSKPQNPSDLSRKTRQICRAPYKEEPRKRNHEGRAAQSPASATKAEGAENEERRGQRIPGSESESGAPAPLSADERAEICRSLGLPVYGAAVAPQ